MKHKVSACIITFNEERNIRDCLESVAWADEIVVIDSGSTDATVAICKERTERVYVRDWPGHVAQKNRAIETASHDWVFCIDADERVTPLLRREIEETLGGEPVHQGYTVPRLTWYLGRWIRHGSWYPDRKLRLFRRSVGRFEGQDPHDRAEVPGSVGHFHGDLLHYSYRDLSHHLQQINKYTDTMAGIKARAGMGLSLLRMLTRPPAKFLKMYALRLGFLDGTPGFIAAAMGAVYEFMKYAKLWDLRREQAKKP